VIKEHRLVREMSGEGRIKGRTVGLSISPIPSRSPSLLSVKDDLATLDPSYTTITEKGKQRAILVVMPLRQTSNILPVHAQLYTTAPLIRWFLQYCRSFLTTIYRRQIKPRLIARPKPEAQPVTSKRKLRPNRNQGILQAVQASSWFWDQS